MEKIAKILLFLFVSFLITPTVVCVIENSVDISVDLNFSEDEQAHKEIKMAFYYSQTTSKIYLSKTGAKIILTENSLQHDEVSLGIFIPPPRLI